jgi:hypothetical protein
VLLAVKQDVAPGPADVRLLRAPAVVPQPHAARTSSSRRGFRGTAPSATHDPSGTHPLHHGASALAARITRADYSPGVFSDATSPVS